MFGADHFVRKKMENTHQFRVHDMFFFDIGASRLEDSTANHQQTII